MRVIVTDRESIERRFLVRSSYALISIRDSDASRARVPKVAGLRGVLHVAFDDAEPMGSFQLPANINLRRATTARSTRRGRNDGSGGRASSQRQFLWDREPLEAGFVRR